ncbi:MAG: ATP-binding protein [Armatimonadetes bacterium]|nr:ATP-binding protein [Armatimonadota bacterium]
MDREAGRTGKNRRPYQWSGLVVVDEVGYTPIDREECNLFYQFVAMRYECRSTIINSNRSQMRWRPTPANGRMLRMTRIVTHCS